MAVGRGAAPINPPAAVSAIGESAQFAYARGRVEHPAVRRRSPRRLALLGFFGSEGEFRLLDSGAATVVGRELPSEIVVRDGAISRQHARFYFEDGDVFVEDLDSRNGTLWRGRPVQRQRLEPG